MIKTVFVQLVCLAVANGGIFDRLFGTCEGKDVPSTSCAIVYDDENCRGWNNDQGIPGKHIPVGNTDFGHSLDKLGFFWGWGDWWSYRNDIESVSVRAGCKFIGFEDANFKGKRITILAGDTQRSWNTVIKMVWDLPFATHKRFLESMTSVPHLQSTLQGRYIGFVENLRKSEKNQLQVLVNLCHQDQSSNTGQNIAFLMDAYESDTLNSLINKKHNIKKHRINPLEEGEEWKIEMLKELSLAKLGFLKTDLEEADISTWLEIVATD